MGTTAGGLPYPEGTDAVMEGDNAIRALAEAVDTIHGQKYLSARLSTPPATAAAWILMQFGAVDALGVTFAAGVMTVPKSGMWQLGCRVRLAAAGAAPAGVQITRNSANADTGTVCYGSAGGGEGFAATGALLRLTAGDLLRTFIYPASQPIFDGPAGTGMDALWVAP